MGLKKTIVLKGTMSCNLRCKYCYEFRQHGNSYVHPSITAKQANAIIRRCAGLFPDSKFLWLLHGGEPLLNSIDVVESILKTIQDVNKTHNVTYAAAIQTNGTLIDSTWVDVFNRYADVFGERILSISIDGPEELEGDVRVGCSGINVHRAIESGISNLKNSSMDFTTISVVGSHTVNEPVEVYRYIKSLNPNFAKFIPCYNYDAAGSPVLFGVTPQQYAIFMCRIFDLWVADLHHKEGNRFVIDPILSIVSKLTGAPVTWCEFIPNKCDNFISIYPDGGLWLCDDYNHETMKDVAFLGNIFELDDVALQNVLTSSSSYCSYQEMYDSLMQDCNSCDIYEHCGGGCLNKRRAMKLCSPKWHDDFCEGKKILIKHIRNAVDHALA